MNDQEKQKIDVIMKDYEILKIYSTITSPSIRYNLISIFFATIGIIISGTIIALANGIEKLSIMPAIVISSLLGAFIPVFSISMLYVWLGEEQRMMRIGEYCKGLEDKINKELTEDILNWEAFKRKKSIQYPEKLIIGIFLGLSLGSSLAGLYLSYANIFHMTPTVFIILIVFDIFAHIGFARFTYIFVKRNIVSIEKLK